MLRSPGDVAAHLGVLVGFEPTESLVAILTRDGQVIVTMRSDIPDDDWVALAGQIVQIANQAEADEAILVVCAARGAGSDLPYATQMAHVAAAVELIAVQVKDVLLVDAGRWWSYGCTTPGCCPVEGTAFTPVGQQQTRDDILAAYQPMEPLPATVLAKAAEELPALPSARAEAALQAARRLAKALDAGLAGCAESENPNLDRDAALVIVAVQDLHVRDYVGGMATFEDGVAEAITHAALVAPAGLRPRVAGLAAAVHATGPSSLPALAMCDLAAGEHLADLVRHSIGCGVPPESIRAILREALPEVVRRLMDRSKPAQNAEQDAEQDAEQPTPDGDVPAEAGSSEAAVEAADPRGEVAAQAATR